MACLKQSRRDADGQTSKVEPQYKERAKNEVEREREREMHNKERKENVNELFFKLPLMRVSLTPVKGSEQNRTR